MLTVGDSHSPLWDCKAEIKMMNALVKFTACRRNENCISEACIDEMIKLKANYLCYAATIT